MATVLALPRLIALQRKGTDDKYLRLVHKDKKLQGFLQNSGDEIVSPYTKFETERSKSDENLVHIRCCYNNKYLVRSSEEDNWIVVAAHEPEEDKSKWSCTLFQPCVTDADGSSFSFLHVQHGGYLDIDADLNCLCIRQVDIASAQSFKVLNMESSVILPQHVTFKGYNDLYLSARVIQSHPYHQFASDDIYDSTIRYEVFRLSNGNVRIKSNHFGKFWRRSPNWIWADSDDTTANNSDTVFWPVKIKDNVIALKNLGNNRFCNALTTEGKTNCLNALEAEVNIWSHLQLYEVVSKREIYNVTFYTENAKIYDVSGGTTVTKEVDNKTQNEEQGTVSFSYKETKSSTWNASHAWSVDVSTTIKTGIPILAEGAISISSSYSGEYSWGETMEQSTEISTNLTVKLPPMTRTKVTLIVTKGAIDVPFSYTQRDTLFSGKIVTSQFEDGLFTGVNTYFKYDIVEQSLSSTTTE
ncbi:uncharacterized protein LOC113854721 [Abrus precatorius]|uniref:Uncharacterized protein LOC113854721 n=1 Tax=Abrus precatorius TaxID=3816 RepID=A0A8B8KD47_ABRPR|nr:uncharacterized protein LOC113854721 [Abrus precatorius]